MMVNNYIILLLVMSAIIRGKEWYKLTYIESV
jgi:hypothetical protein